MDGSDLLSGLAAIGRYCGWTERQAKNQHERGLIPTFKQGGLVCARKSTLDAHFLAQEAAGRG